MYRLLRIPHRLPPPRRMALASMALWLSVSAALALQGKVVRRDGSPVADATVTIVGRTGSGRTDRQGLITWQPDPAPPFQVLVELPGGELAQPVLVEAVPPDGPLIVTVSPLATEAVVVTAPAAPHIEASPAAAVGLLAQEDLEQRHPQRLVDALENIPGTGRIGGGREAVPTIRGLGRGRTLILIDGARVTTERRAGPSATPLDPFFLEAVEVSRGPGSVAYGSDALGGVIHARTPQATPGSPLRARVVASGGVGAPEAGVGAEISKGMEEGGFLFQARARRFGDYDSPEGEVENSEADDYGFLGRLDHEAGPGRFSVAWRTDAVRDMERPATDSATNRVSQPREDSDRLTLAYRMDALPSDTLLGVEGFAGSYRLVTEQDRLATATRPEEVYTSDVRANDFGLRAQATQLLSKARLAGGLDLNGRFDLEATGSNPFGEDRPIEDARRNDAALYLSGEAAPWRALEFGGGLRYDQVTTHNAGGYFGDRSTSEGSTSGFLSVTCGPFAGFRITAQAARGFRDPTLSDRYYVGISGRGFVTGNPDLEPETSFQLDLALRYTARRARAALYAYDYRIEDLIERYEDGTDPATGFDAFFFRNRGEGSLRGVELEVSADLGTAMSLEVGAQAARGEAEDGSDLDDVPPDGVTLQWRWSLGASGYVLARGAAYARDDRPGPNEVETPGFATLDLGGGWRPARDLDLRLLIRNVLDHPHPASPDAKSELAAGRSALLTLAAWFGRR